VAVARDDVDTVFCTILDVNFLTRGLVLHRSLARVARRFVLRVFCVDDRSLRLLRELSLPGLEALPLAALEEYDPGLREVRDSRALDEYCWTAKPVMCLHALETAPEAARVVYADADLMFWSDPQALFDDLGDDSILLVPHNAALLRQCTYNAGFLLFANDANTREALEWWRERCFEWCYDRTEDGKHGDQGYLDQFPRLFSGVRVMRHPGGIVAPWNADQHAVARDGDGVAVDGRPLVFYHYQSLRLLPASPAVERLARAVPAFRRIPGRPALAWTRYAGYDLSPSHLELVWEPYARRLAEELLRVQEAEPGFSAGLNRGDARGVALELARQVVPDRLKKAALQADEWWRARLLGRQGRSQPRHFFG